MPLVPVDHDPFADELAPPSPVAADVAAFPQRAAGLAISALGPLGDAGMTVGDWLRTRGSSFDTRDIAPVAAGVMLGTAAPEADEAAPVAGLAKRVAQSDFGILPPSQDWITQWARRFGVGQRPKREILDEWAKQNNIPIKWEIARTGSGYAIVGDPSVKTPSGAAGQSTRSIGNSAQTLSAKNRKPSKAKTFGPSLPSRKKDNRASSTSRSSTPRRSSNNIPHWRSVIPRKWVASISRAKKSTVGRSIWRSGMCVKAGNWACV